jgi:hypothetical protein
LALVGSSVAVLEGPPVFSLVFHLGDGA